MGHAFLQSSELMFKVRLTGLIKANGGRYFFEIDLIVFFFVDAV